jgi:hypothetical protein
MDTKEEAREYGHRLGRETIDHLMKRPNGMAQLKQALEAGRDTLRGNLWMHAIRHSFVMLESGAMQDAYAHAFTAGAFERLDELLPPSRWRLVGHDTFDCSDYPLSEHDTEDEAVRAARERLRVLDVTQPPESSGGQDVDGIQDRVFIVTPYGARRRFVG